MKRKISIPILSAVLIITVAAFALRACQTAKSDVAFQTTPVTKGNISNTVTATGTIQAIKTVAVGTQVSGVISKLYVDFNSVVKKGQILAQIDRTPLLASLDQSKAQVESAIADLNYKKATYERIKALYEKKLIAKGDYDQAVLNYEQSKANLSNANSVNDRNKINLAYATIYSPINGVVLNRAVDEGQTVAASFNTPTLFSIANDLTQMQVEAAVDEADIGQVKLGERVEFTVDAYPDLKFKATVTQIRLQPVITSNVVTYTVIMQAPNPEQKLMPGMTANANIFVDEAKDLTIVNSKALHFTPDSKLMTSYMKQHPQADKARIERSLNSKAKSTSDDGTGNKPVTLWVKRGNEISPVKVVTGVTDGINIEVKSGVKEGDQVIFAMQSAAEMEAETTTAETAKSPFMPQRPRSRQTTK
ncbi:MAG: efflux RND transporter periplasmic adaptor subunit [Bacteroidota bacterium]|nr:efflux RND transporter periplasmic adaptor subunit [Bacteroidota bacterium]